MKINRQFYFTVFILFVVVTSLIANPQPVQAICAPDHIIYVSPTGSGAGGCTWATAFTTLQSALAVASGADPDQIWVQSGTYYPDEGTGQTNNDRNSTYTLIDGVSVYGGFAGTETLLTQRNPTLNVTILSGDIDQIAGNANNAYNVVTITGAITETYVLDGFTITAGNSDSSGQGGGIFISDASPSFANLIITANNASNLGGGVFVTSPGAGSTAANYSAPTFTDVTFTSNTANIGGGLYLLNASPTLTRVTFSSNTSATGAGGGMNSQTSGGSGVDEPNVPTLTDVAFITNTAVGGGGLYNNNSNAVLNNVTFSGNVANRRGGGILNEFASPSLTNVTFNNNTSNNNLADPRGGGGIMNITSSPTLNNVTFSGNTSSANGVDGGGIRNALTSNPVIQNTILWGNATGEVTSDGTGTITVVDSVVQGGCPAGATCTNIITTDPQLSALASNGGFTQTMAIGATSSALDTGGVNFACAATDQRGTSRPQGAACDIGAYERGDVTPPTLTSFTRFNPLTTPTNADVLVFRATFNEGVLNVSTGDFVVNGTTTATVTGVATVSTSVYEITVSGGDLAGFNGVVGLDLAGGQNITDLTGNALPAGEPATDETYLVDNTAPTVTIDQAVAQADPTNATPINFTVVFSEATTNFATGDVTLGGTAGATTATVTGGPTTFNVAVSGMTGDGTVIASVAAGVATDAAGNNNAASTSTDNTVTYDTTGPTVTINQAVAQADPTNATPINFTVVFSEATTNFATGDVTLAGTAGATTAIVTGGPTTFNVAVSGMTGDGTVIAAVAAGVATDAAGNNNAASTSTDNTVTYDTTAPTVTINQAVAQADPTNASPINFTVVFSEATTNFATGDVTLAGTAGATTATVTGGPTTFNVAVSGMTGDGTVIASVAAGVATDAAGNNNTASTSTDNTVTYDTTGPTVTIDQAVAQADPTNATPINFTVVFSEATTNFATGDVTLAGTAGATTAVVTGGPTTFNVAVSGMTGDGTVIASIAAGVATDAAGNNNAASTSTDNTVTYDTTAPTVTINQAVAQADPTNATPINFTVVFSEATTNFATGDVTLAGTAGATTAVVTGGPTTFNVAVSGMTGDGTVIASVAAGVATDAAGNNNAASTSTDNTVTYDTTGPTVTIDQAVAQADPTNATPINFTVVFSEATTNFATGDVTLAGTAGATTAIVTGGPTTFNVAVSGMTGDGTVIASVAAGVATDAAGNSNAASTSTDNTVTYDATGPTVTINQAVAQADPTNATPINFTVVFSEVTTNFATGDVTLAGTAGATTAIVTGGPTTFNVAVSGMTGDGTVIASVAAGVATDALGNNNSASTSTDNTVTFDTNAPTVTIDQAVAQADPTNATPINFTVVFSEATTNFATGDVTLAGTAGATTATVTGGPTTYNVAVSGMTGDGTVIASVAAGVATDAAGNSNAASTSTDNTVTYDTTGPTVTINQAVAQADPTNTSPINFTVVFSEATTNFATGDVTLAGTAGATTAIVTGGPTTFNVAVSGMTGDGTVIASVAANIATDALGNNNSASTSTDNTVTYDTTAPTVTINQAVAQADPTNATPINFTVVFSEATTNFATGDVTLAGTAGATTATVTGGPTTFNVAVSGMTGNGTVIASVTAGVATDAAGNNNAASTSTDNTVTYDATGPTVTIDQAVAQADPTSASPINFTVVFSEATTNFATGDVTLAGTAGATTAVVTGGPTTFNVAVSGMATDGTVIATIAAGVATDSLGNNNLASTSTDNTVTYDTGAPTITINQAVAQPDPTNASPINFTVTFSENVTSFIDTDVTLSSGTAVVTGGPAVYNVAVTGMSQGVLTATVAAGVASDGAGNTNVASTSTDNTVTYDTVAPTVTINQAVAQPDPTNASPINFTVVFSEATTNFATGDVTLAGTAGATTATVTGGPTTFNVAVSGMTGDGTVIASVAAGVATDAAGNSNAASTSTDNTVTYDATGPTVTINQAVAQADPTNTSPINFTVVFSEATTNFATGDVTLAGTAGATTATVTGGPTTFNVAVSGMASDGTVIATIGAGVATDALGNGNAASTSTDNTVTYDTTGPTVTINQAVAQPDPTNVSPINFTVVFSEATTNFATGDVTLAGTAGATTATVTGGPTTFNVAVSGMTSNGTVIASVGAGVATDALGNGNSASTSTDNTVTYDTTGPIVTIGAPSLAITTTGPVDFAITITGGTTFNLTVADITLNTTGTATGTITVTNGATANPTVTISATTGSGTIGISIAAGIASDGLGNTSAAAGPSTTFIVDNGGPVVTASVPANATSVTGPIQLTVTFNEDVSAATGNNVANYLLLNDSGDGFDDAPTLTTCLTGPNPNAGNDLNIAINSAVYANGGGSGPFVSTLGINGGVPLPVGVYRLYVCGTTSIEDLVGNELNNGLNDTIIEFTVIAGTIGGGGTTRLSIPATGFAQGEVTSLPMQPADKAYTATNLWIEIPKLNVKMSIVGVPQTKTGWEVTWLGRDAGWLNGSAFPTWNGNSVITGHVWDAVGKPGPFALLKDLKYGDQVKIHAFGQVFTYEIRESSLISPTSITTMMQHEEKSWITLITCEVYNEKSETYSYRRMVRAVLVSVTPEK